MRIVTYNIRGALGVDGRRSTRRIADVLREIDADVICLQEVHRRLPWSGFRDQPAILRRLLGMQVVFQSNYDVGIGGFGNAIAARLPILSQASHRLQNPRERASILRMAEHRGLFELTLQTPTGALAVLTTHWSLHAEDRIESAAVVTARIRELKAPVILCGDFNSGPESPEIRALLAETGLVDSAAENPLATYPSDSPAAQIDYVFHSPSIIPTGAGSVLARASDHLPLVLEW